MSAMANRMRDRIQLKKAVQTPDSVSGGFTMSYETLLTLWAEVLPVSHNTYIRGVRAETGVTHEVTIRRLSLNTLSAEFSRAFDNSFKGADIHPLKSEFFIFVPRDSDTKGLLMRVRRTRFMGLRRENLNFLCEEIEEQATGWGS